MNVIETRLPGIGVRREIVTGSGRRVGIVAQRDGDLDLIISKATDPDACVASIPLTPDEAATIGNLLGSRQLVAQLTEEHRDLPGVASPDEEVAAGGLVQPERHVVAAHRLGALDRARLALRRPSPRGHPDALALRCVAGRRPALGSGAGLAHARLHARCR